MEKIRAKFVVLSPVMDERLARAGAEAESIGEGGNAIVEKATGMSRTTIRVGRDELRKGVDPGDVVKVRRAGGGRPAIEERSPGYRLARVGGPRSRPSFGRRSRASTTREPTVRSTPFGTRAGKMGSSVSGES